MKPLLCFLYLLVISACGTDPKRDPELHSGASASDKNSPDRPNNDDTSSPQPTGEPSSPQTPPKKSPPRQPKTPDKGQTYDEPQGVIGGNGGGIIYCDRSQSPWFHYSGYYAVEYITLTKILDTRFGDYRKWIFENERTVFSFDGQKPHLEAPGVIIRSAEDSERNAEKPRSHQLLNAFLFGNDRHWLPMEEHLSPKTQAEIGKRMAFVYQNFYDKLASYQITKFGGHFSLQQRDEFFINFQLPKNCNKESIEPVVWRVNLDNIPTPQMHYYFSEKLQNLPEFQQSLVIGHEWLWDYFSFPYDPDFLESRKDMTAMMLLVFTSDTLLEIHSTPLYVTDRDFSDRGIILQKYKEIGINYFRM